jgi:hypothetical protein
MTKLRACLLMIGFAVLMAGCQTTTADGFKPIRPTRDDVRTMSDSLATQILQHNEHGAAIGAWGKP